MSIILIFLVRQGPYCNTGVMRVLIPEYDKVLKHMSVACRLQAIFEGREEIYMKNIP